MVEGVKAGLRTRGLWFVLVLAGCELSMPLGDLSARADADADADSDSGADADADTDTDVDACSVGFDPEGCRVVIDAPPHESIGGPIAAGDALHTTSWTFTSLQADANGRLYAFFWWVSPDELDAPEVPISHLAWRTRASDEEAWSELRAVPGVTAEQLRDAECSSPSQAPLEFAATDDGYVHAFWRKNASCRGGDIWYVEHAMFEEGAIAYREEMPIGCGGGRTLEMKDALGLPDGEVLVAFLCGSEGRLQRFSCGCWEESTTVPEGNVESQDDLQLVRVGGETWIVVREKFIHDLWARRLDGPGDFLRVSDDGAVVGSSVPSVDSEGALWVAWQSSSIPSNGVYIARLEDAAFEPATMLPGGTTVVQAFDALDAPGRGPTILTEETFAVEGAEGEPNVVHDEFWIRSYADGAWSPPVLAASSVVEIDGVPVRHTASDLAVAAGRTWISYVTFVGGGEAYALHVVEAP